MERRNRLEKPNRWVETTRESFFALHPYEFDCDKNWYEKIRLTQYCKIKHISRKQVRTLIKRKWLAITRFKRRIWVHELEPEKINEYLQLEPCRATSRLV